jgi:1-deoxy-D-xylulose-5-phosphate reductoisomerase
VCIASKEIYLLFGREISRISKKFGGELIPIDSEHSALFQLIRNEPRQNIRKLYITASGGPFFNKKKSELKNVKPKDALNHPTWNMGKKISIDSATMMNKAIEIIEASIMFDLPSKIILPIVNLESRIHAAVEFVDGNYMISGSHNDMRIPISYSLNYPFRHTNGSFRFKPSKMIELIPIKEKDYKAIRLARKAMNIGGSMPTVMNAANSVAVEEFLNNKINFLDILKIIEKTMKKHEPKFKYSLKEILKINAEASKDAFNIANQL